jgi:hypothetical protein
MNLMVGSTDFAEKSHSNINEKIWDFIQVSRCIMENTAKLNQIPVAFADRWKLNVWKSFENATWKSIESCRNEHRME